MSTTAQIRQALADALTGAYSAGWNVSAYLLSKPEPPQLEVAVGQTVYDTAMNRGNDQLTYTVRASVAWGDAVSAQQNLDGLLDLTASTAIKTVLEQDRTLGGVVSALRVTEASAVQVVSVQGGPELVGVDFTVEVTP